MTLVPGSRLGPYEITAPLGEGGMGVVYRATDSKLKREVAIKVLPEAFAADADRLARFEREAQVLAQLQHPNIASIYGLEESGGVRALVMELVEGEDLAERLKRGPLPLDEALAVARQIAEALEAAHEKGIVHRDLKPANVKLTPEGKVKVLDFGLAKAMDPPRGSASAADLARSPTLMNSPTMTAAHGTQLGVILGTAAYMAPEQARGGTVDKRADIWAFGVVLHEMLTGRPLFAADTVSDTLAGVLKTEIDLASASGRDACRRSVASSAAASSAIRRTGCATSATRGSSSPTSKPASRGRGDRFARDARSRQAARGRRVGPGSGRDVRGSRPSLRTSQLQASCTAVIRATLPLPAGVSISSSSTASARGCRPSPPTDGVSRSARAGPPRCGLGPRPQGPRRCVRSPQQPRRLPPLLVARRTEGRLLHVEPPATTPSEGGAVARLAPARDARRRHLKSPNGTILFAPFATGPLLAIFQIRAGQPARFPAHGRRSDPVPTGSRSSSRTASTRATSTDRDASVQRGAPE